MAFAPLELAWLHHEFCKFLIDIHRFDLARFYAKKGRDIAQEAGCEEWILNVDHLILRIEIHQNNRNEAREAAVLALACARKLGIDYLVKIKSHNFATTRAHNSVAALRSNLFDRSIPDYISFKISSRLAFKKISANNTDQFVISKRSLLGQQSALMFPLFRATRVFAI